MPHPLSALKLLLNGTSKASIGEAFELVFEHRATPLQESDKEHISELFSASPEETEAVLLSYSY